MIKCLKGPFNRVCLICIFVLFVSGKAELFKQGLNELNKKNMSKACVIQ